jgi:hypothetical protein
MTSPARDVATGGAGFTDVGPEDPGTPDGGADVTLGEGAEGGDDVATGDLCGDGAGGPTATRAAVGREPDSNDSGPAVTSLLYAATCHTSAAAATTMTKPTMTRSAEALRVGACGGGG